MKGTLLLTILNIQSSYARDLEETVVDASCVPDTLQWWIGSEEAWRIRTYALDHDIHTYSISLRPGLLELAQSNNRKHYAGLIVSEHTLTFSDCTDVEEVARLCGAAGIAERIEVALGRFAFWKPDDARYWSQTAPE